MKFKNKQNLRKERKGGAGGRPLIFAVSTGCHLLNRLFPIHITVRNVFWWDLNCPPVISNGAPSVVWSQGDLRALIWNCALIWHHYPRYLWHLQRAEVEEEVCSSPEARTRPAGTAVDGCQLFVGAREIKALLNLTAQACSQLWV